jgi:dTDP-4-dehydrorhamnose reductase
MRIFASNQLVMMLVTGAGGQLGQCFQMLATGYPDQRFYFANSGILDIADRRSVDRFFKQHVVTAVINCAAYTAVDKAESEPEKARKINVNGVQNLARACSGLQIPLVHFSTDYVYHNRQNTPFKESDPVSPKSVYARTKLAGERAALKTHPDTMVIRTSWVYSEFGQNFVKTMLRVGRERASLNVVFDQIGTPTYAPDLADAVLKILEKIRHGSIAPAQIGGIWHYSNEGVTSWYDFAGAVFEMKRMACIVHPIETRDYPTPARRPPFSVLNKVKIKMEFGLEVPHWRDGLRRCLEQIP